MLHKAQFEEVANAVAGAVHQITDEALDPAAAKAELRPFVEALANQLSWTNEWFDAARFLDAAGFPTTPTSDPATPRVWPAWRPPDPQGATRPVSPQDEHLRKRYEEDGAFLRDLAVEFDTTTGDLRERLTAIGVRVHPGGPRPGTPRPAFMREPPTEEEVKQMVERYRAGLTLAQVGAEFGGFHASTVAQHIRPFIEIRGKGGSRR